jgi:hypothetical protein
VFYAFWAIGTQLYCGRISQKSNPPDSMTHGSAEFESVVTNIGTGRDVITSLSVSTAHSHLFIALADGQCMRWTFAASPDPTATVVVETSTDLVFTKTSDIRLGHIHSMHASPYGSYLTMTRSAQPPTYTSSLRLPKAIYIHRCNTDVIVFPIQVAANTAYFIIPWNGSAALDLYSTCQRSVSYWRDTLLAIWSLVGQTSLPLEHSFRGLQIMFVLLTGCPPSFFPFDGALMCIRSILYLRALASAGATSSIAQFHCEELFEPARVLAVKLSKDHVLSQWVEQTLGRKAAITDVNAALQQCLKPSAGPLLARCCHSLQPIDLARMTQVRML